MSFMFAFLARVCNSDFSSELYYLKGSISQIDYSLEADNRMVFPTSDLKTD